jgi:ubiquinone/menaquinone biosynthesis C-methylase UbiE
LTAHKSFHDERERRRWQNPEAILVDIGLRSGFTFMDIGCGDGFFALPAARLVGEEGKVYGLDVDSEAIRRLKEKASREGLRNVQLKVGAAEETVFCEACADVVFFSIVLHDFDDPSRVLLNAKRMLKQTGTLVDLDWKKKHMELGPPIQTRFSEEKAVDLIEAAGFKVETVEQAGQYHYLIVAGP